jgi:DNA integrity scanning protein DisA with diadenylate cyclase activity
VVPPHLDPAPPGDLVKGYAMTLKLRFLKIIDAYHRIEIPMNYAFWSMWGSFVTIIGAGALAYILLPLTNILYTSLALLFYTIIIVLLWLILTFDNLREGSNLNKISKLEQQLSFTREEFNDLSIALQDNIQAMKEHGL